MRERDEDIADFVFDQKVFAGACDEHSGLAEVIPADLEVRPLDLPTPAHAESFEDSFLGCPASGEVFGRSGFGVAVLDLMRREDTLEEVVAMLGNHSSNAGTFDDVGAQTVDVHRSIVAMKHSGGGN